MLTLFFVPDLPTQVGAPYSFNSDDIVAWNGTVLKFGSIAHLTSEGDEIRKATDEERADYKNKNM